MKDRFLVIFKYTLIIFFWCFSKLSNSSELEDSLNTIYCATAQHNVPPVQKICEAIDLAANKTDILGQIFEGVVAYNEGPKSCYDLNGDEPPEFKLGWQWQVINLISLSYY